MYSFELKVYNGSVESKNSNGKIEITKYTDYVPYINDLVEYRRKTSNFSFRKFCKKSGFKSPTYLKWVMDGIRPISLKGLNKFIDGLSLEKREAQYFTLMVNFKEAKDPETKRLYYEQMLCWQERRIGPMTKDAYEYLSHWHHVAVRELIGTPDFQDDVHWIRARLAGKLTIWDIKNSLDTLERLRLIKRTKSGNWKQTERDLHTEKEVTSLAAYNYHKEMLRLAEDILLKRNAKERDYRSLVAVLDEETFAKLKNRFHQFQRDLVEFLNEEEEKRKKNRSGSGLELYALNMQIMPLTTDKWRKE